MTPFTTPRIFARLSAFVSTATVSLLATAPAFAQTEEVAKQVVHMAKPWQLNFQEAASPVMERLEHMHDWLLVVCFGVSIFVLLATAFIAIKFNRKSNPTPSTTTHNTMLEIVWTTIPILILVAIAIPSVRAHYFMEQEPENGITLKVTGNQWYWSYAYPDQGGFGFDSYMLSEEDAKAAGKPRLLGTDNRVVVPVNTPVRVLLTGADVIHAWALPAFGVKRDAVPGRLNESWFEATKEGTFYGQCSELCGKLHGFMPIEVEVVSKEKFDAWVAEQQAAAGIDPATINATEAPATEVPAEAAPAAKTVTEVAAPATEQAATETQTSATEKTDTTSTETAAKKPAEVAKEAETVKEVTKKPTKEKVAKAVKAVEEVAPEDDAALVITDEPEETLEIQKDEQ